MKKTVIVLALIVVVILVATPFVGGVVMERHVRSYLEYVNEIYDDYFDSYSLEIVSYDRGYATTDIEFMIDLGPMKEVYGVESIIVTEHARHGYSGIVSTTSLEKNEWFQTFVNDKLQGNNPLHIETCYSFFGAVESTMVVDPFSVVVEGETLDVKSGKIMAATDRTFSTYAISGSLGGMSIEDKLSIGEVSIKSDMEKISTLIWDGDLLVGIKGARISDEDVAIDLKDMEVAYDLEVDKDADIVEYGMRLSFDSLQTNNQNINDASISFSLNGIDRSAYEEVMQIYMQTYSQMMSDLENVDEESEAYEAAAQQAVAEAGMQMMGVYEKLLKKDLEIRISDLHLEHATGKIDGDVTLRLLQDMTIAQFAPALYQPHLLLDVLYLESDISLPAQLVGENPNLLSPLFPGMQTGIFIKDGDKLSHKAQTKDGMLLLNGEELNLGG